MSKRLSPRVSEAKAKEVYDAAVNLLGQVATYYAGGGTINEIIFGPLAIMTRIIRTYDAIVVLLDNQHAQEAAVLALTQFELRFDLLYVASDIKRATQWVEHDNPKGLNRSMKAKLDALVRPIQAERLYETFVYLSGIKHGNPLYSELGFPGRGRGAQLMFSTGPITDRFAKAFTRTLFAYAVYQLIWSAQVVNKLVVKYTSIEKEHRQRVQGLYLELRPLETEFRRFLKARVIKRKTFFGIAARKRV